MSKPLPFRLWALSLLIVPVLLSASSEAQPQRVCVTDFVNHGHTEEHTWLGRFIADSIENNLKVFPEVLLTHDDDSSATTSAEDTDDVRSRFSAAGRSTNAQIVVGGDFRGDGEKLSVNTYIFGAREETLIKETSFVSTIPDLYSPLDDLSVSLVGSLDIPCSNEQLANMSRIPTTSPEAIISYGKALELPPASAERAAFLLKAIAEDPDYTDALLKLGVHYYEAGEFVEARDTFRKLTEIQPDYPHTYYNLGLVYRARKEYPMAVQMYRKALAVEPKNPDAWNNLGTVYYLMGEHEDAANAFRRAAEISPDDPHARTNLQAMARAYGSDYVERSRSKSSLNMLKEHIEVGAALYATGAYWRAIGQFEAALKMQPDNFKANNNIALAYMKIGETEKAREHFERAFEADPTAIDVGEKLAELRKAGAATHGVQQIDTDSAQPLQHSLALCALGQVYLYRGAYQQAVDAFSQALDASPDDVDARNGLGTAYLALGEYEKARAQFMKVLSLNPENETATQKLTDIEFILAALQEEANGQQSFQISLDSQIEARARYVRANELYEEGKYEEAAGEYLRACDLAPTSVEILNNLGTTYYALQRYEEAKAVLKKAHQLDPNSALINSNLGALTMALQAEKPAEMKQLEMVPESSEPRERTEAETEPAILPVSDAVTESSGDGEDALEEQRSPDRRNEGGQIQANEPEKPADSALSHLNMGTISEEAGDIEGALRHYREAVRLEPHNARAHFNLGNIYFRIGAFDSAIECYWATVEADPSFALSYNNMGVAYHRRGNRQEATLAWRRALEADPSLESAKDNLRKFGVPETSRSEAPAE